MNTAQLAEALGVNYQVVNRAARALQKEDGTWTRNKGKLVAGVEFSPEFEARIRQRIKLLRVKHKNWNIRSTPEERAAWLAVWEPAFDAAPPERWVWFAAVLATINWTRKPRWLDQKSGAYRVGDNAVYVAMQAGADVAADGRLSGFTAWLVDHGFNVWKQE